MNQVGKSEQKNCIYRAELRQAPAAVGSRQPKNTKKFYQVRVKNLNFLGKSATAVYFYDFSNQIKTL